MSFLFLDWFESVVMFIDLVLTRLMIKGEFY